MTQENLLARYTILHELGRGAIGAVHAARDRSTGAVVALKALDPALFSEPNAQLAELFLKNARAAGRLRHANIVMVVDAGEAGGTAYVAMELVEGESLRHMLDERPLPIARAIRIFDDIVSALAYAHEEGMVHRGVKPSNIMVLPSGAAKIGDFGTGQIGEAALRYMSPEQVRRDPVDHRSDLFSLGAVFYEMLTRRTPFEGDSPEQIRQNILRAEPPPPSKLNPLVPGALDALVLRLLAGRPDDRFADARALLRDLQRLEEGLGLRPAASAGAAEPAASAPPAAPQPEIRDVHDDFRIHEEYDYRKTMMEREREAERNRSKASRIETFAAVGVVLVVLVAGLGGFLYFSSGPSKRDVAASRVQQAPAAPAPTAPPPVAEASKEPVAAVGEWQKSPPRAASTPEPMPQKAVVTERIPQAQGAAPAAAPEKPRAITPPPVAEAIKEPESSGTLFGLKPTPSNPLAADPGPSPQANSPVALAPKPTAKVPAQRPGGTATLVIAVSPQAELYIDDKHYGTTLPITTLNLEPGMHRIEIRSGSRKPYLTYMTVEAGDERRIRHDFDAKPSRPPG